MNICGIYLWVHPNESAGFLFGDGGNPSAGPGRYFPTLNEVHRSANTVTWQAMCEINRWMKIDDWEMMMSWLFVLVFFTNCIKTLKCREKQTLQSRCHMASDVWNRMIHESWTIPCKIQWIPINFLLNLLLSLQNKIYRFTWLLRLMYLEQLF